MQQSTLLIAEAISMKIAEQNINDCTDSNCYHSWYAPKCHETNAWLGEGVELLTTINLIGDWPMGKSDLCALKCT
jgi:hypothetical protein